MLIYESVRNFLCVCVCLICMYVHACDYVCNYLYVCNLTYVMCVDVCA